MLKFNELEALAREKANPDLNTSYVKVQLQTLTVTYPTQFYLNTSYVKVQ